MIRHYNNIESETVIRIVSRRIISFVKLYHLTMKSELSPHFSLQELRVALREGEARA